MQSNEKLSGMLRRFEEIDRALANPSGMAQASVGALMKERGQLAPVVELYRQIQEVRRKSEEARSIVSSGDDPELAALAKEDLVEAQARETWLAERLEDLLLEEPNDEDRGVILEVRPGTGGEEAALFAGDLVRMYGKYAERKGWTMETIELAPSDLGGIKSATFSIHGKGAWRSLKWEGGTHRVQRVPATEASGRIHTSAATVAVLPEAGEVEVQLKPEELKIETACAGGPGGQHVNKTESAVRMVHLPTGIEVKSRTDRSQHRNRELAYTLLKAKLLEHYSAQRQKEESRMRRLQVGSGDRSEKIRTYNFPQNRVTDHRVGATWHRLGEILQGDLDEVASALRGHEKKKRLEAMREASEGRDARLA